MMWTVAMLRMDIASGRVRCKTALAIGLRQSYVFWGMLSKIPLINLGESGVL